MHLLVRRKPPTPITDQPIKPILQSERATRLELKQKIRKQNARVSDQPYSKQGRPPDATACLPGADALSDCHCRSKVKFYKKNEETIDSRSITFDRCDRAVVAGGSGRRCFVFVFFAEIRKLQRECALTQFECRRPVLAHARTARRTDLRASPRRLLGIAQSSSLYAFSEIFSFRQVHFREDAKSTVLQSAFYVKKEAKQNPPQNRTA